jgi:hypothetical protein
LNSKKTANERLNDTSAPVVIMRERLFQFIAVISVRKARVVETIKLASASGTFHMGNQSIGVKQPEMQIKR